MKIRLFALTLSAVALWLTATGMAASSSAPLDLESTALFKLGEAGGPTLAILLSMHWLRESYQRRLEEGQRYSDALSLLQKEHREELRRVRPRKKLRSSGKEAIQDE